MSAATLAPAAAEHDLQELLDRHHGHLFTMDPIEGIAGWYAFVDGHLVVFARNDQDPAVTLELTREYLARTGRAA
jgi:hypothetical protein